MKALVLALVLLVCADIVLTRGANTARILHALHLFGGNVGQATRDSLFGW